MPGQTISGKSLQIGNYYCKLEHHMGNPQDGKPSGWKLIRVYNSVGCEINMCGSQILSLEKKSPLVENMDPPAQEHELSG